LIDNYARRVGFENTHALLGDLFLAKNAGVTARVADFASTIVTISHNYLSIPVRMCPGSIETIRFLLAPCIRVQ
jgi:hypothetical protein